ncbi:hypothetical protein [Streptomyces sp. NPDC015131]|uniref:hypothetical protein n=1 Tax=Streptomyces sp. NPDC015131 TaxID=3364941 RepID=UPI0036FB3256
MELTPDELVAEFRDAVTELYFARKRIAALEAHNATLSARLAEAEARTEAEAEGAPRAKADPASAPGAP